MNRTLRSLTNTRARLIENDAMRRARVALEAHLTEASGGATNRAAKVQLRENGAVLNGRASATPASDAGAFATLVESFVERGLSAEEAIAAAFGRGSDHSLAEGVALLEAAGVVVHLKNGTTVDVPGGVRATHRTAVVSKGNRLIGRPGQHLDVQDARGRTVGSFASNEVTGHHLAEAFRGLGLSPEAAALAAKGRS